MKTILLVFGTRPEAIKMAPLVLALKRQKSRFRTLVCVTGQQRQMLDQVLRVFDIEPDYDLDIMKPNQDLYDVTSAVLTGMREVLREVRPDLVLVHGDTTTSTSAALAAFYQRVRVGHVEAGLRTGDIYSPWPEEMNRQLTGRLASLHLAPTESARLNLLREGVDEKQIVVTGNTVIDALMIAVDRLRRDERWLADTESRILQAGYDLRRLTKGRRMILITGHRRENFGDGFLSICRAIRRLSERYEDVDWVYPVHLNPNVRKPVYELLGDGLDNVFLIEPLQYLEFVLMMERSYLVLTDSGGVQEEAPSLGKPVLVMRDTTERPEAVEAGTVVLVGTDEEKIVAQTATLLSGGDDYERMSKALNPYGDGKACERIVNKLSES